MQSSDKNIHKLFSIKTLIHTNTFSKTTHSIKASLIKTMLYMFMQVSSWKLIHASWELTQVPHGN